jgi:phage-related protein
MYVVGFMDERELIFLGTSLEDINFFPLDARRESGFQLGRVQSNKEPSDWKPFSSIGAGVKEIRIKKDGVFRIMYVTKFKDRVYVLHAFKKKDQKTRKSDIELAKERYKGIYYE